MLSALLAAASVSISNSHHTSIAGTTCTNGCKADAQPVHLSTTPFMPSDNVTNACGTQLCEAWQMAAGNCATSFECVYYSADYGGGTNAYNIRSHPDCGSAVMVEFSINCFNRAGQFTLTPATPKLAKVGTTETAGGAAPWGYARNFTVGCYAFSPCASAIPIPAKFDFPSWYTGATAVDPTLNGPVACRLRCAANAQCDYWSYEFEDGYHECFLVSVLPPESASLDMYLFFSSNNIIQSPTAGFQIVSPCTGSAPTFISGGTFTETSTSLIDPRPAGGSAAYSNGDLVPHVDDFFSATTYKGAFGRVNWLDGWSFFNLPNCLGFVSGSFTCPTGVGAPAPGSPVYRLRWVGDYQTGAWNKIGTFNVAANLRPYCQVTSCIYQNMDYGGWASPCGYAPMLRVTVNGAIAKGAIVNSATGVPTGVLPLQLTLIPRANGQPEAINTFGTSVACIETGSNAIELCGPGLSPGQVAQGRCTSAYLNKPLISFSRHVALNQRGLMTMCQLTPNIGSVAIDCTVYQVNSTNFVPAATGSYPGFLTAQQYRMLDVRLYGPSGDSVSADVQPESGVFTAGGRFFIVSCVNIVFDVTLRKYVRVRMEGYGYKEMTMGASDRDNGIFIRSGWGTNSATKSYGMYQPDVISAWTQDGLYYFITANEGDSRDGMDLIGVFGSFAGEEIRTASINATTCTIKANEQLGRLTTTAFMPSDYVANACGTQICEAWQMAAGNSAASFECVYYGADADYGGATDVYDVCSHPECGYAVTDEFSVNCLNRAGQFALTLATPKRAIVGIPETAGGAAPWGYACHITVGCSAFAPCTSAIPIPANLAFPSWYTGATVVYPTLSGPVACRRRCAANAQCDYWSYEFEDGYHECFLKRKCATVNCVDCAAPAPRCDIYVRWSQHWGNQGGVMNKFGEDFGDPKTCPAATALFTTEWYTAAQTTHVGHGIKGGHTSVGARSFSIWSWNGAPSSSFVRVFDLGAELEQKAMHFPGSLGSACIDSTANSASCLVWCPFNSDVAGCGNPPPPRPLPPPAPSPPYVGYLPSNIAANTQVTRSVVAARNSTVTEISRNNFANQTACADNGAIGSLVAQLRLSGAMGARGDALSRNALSPALPGTEEVKAEAAGAIWVLSEGHVENKITIAIAGGIAPTVSLIAP